MSNQHPFKLKIIDTVNIMPHEKFDTSRASGLIQKIKKSQVFTNPILVAHVEGEKYMQIDGMNRYSALKELKIKSVLAQVIDYNDKSAVDISTWCHLNTFSKKDFLEKIANITEISVSPVGVKYLRPRFIRNKGTGFLCCVTFIDGSIYRIATNGVFADKIKVLNKIVDLYKDNIVRGILPDEANMTDLSQMFKKNDNLQTLIIFPSFTHDQIIDSAVYKQVLFPGGVTRFIIRNRCLDVGIPLSMLKSSKTDVEKNVLLNKFLSDKTYRIYQEPTVYFEP